MSIESSDDESMNIHEEPLKAENENLLAVLSNVVSRKFCMRRKSSYSPGSMNKLQSSPVRRKSTNDAYKLNRKNVLENVSMLATGPCGWDW